MMSTPTWAGRFQRSCMSTALRDSEIVNFILSFHENVEVVSPPELRVAFKKKLQNALKQYR